MKKSINISILSKIGALTTLLLLLAVPNPAYAFVDMLRNFVLDIAWHIATGIGGFVVWLGGTFLNFAINYLVVGFGNYYTDSGIGIAVDMLWTLVRDMMNILFIFGLVFIGLKMIFNSADNSAKKMLGTLVVAALLINFSLFFAKAIIEVSHVFSYQIASIFLEDDLPAGTLRFDVSDRFMEVIGFQSIFEVGGYSVISRPDNASWTYIIGTFAMLMVAGTVFLGGAMILLRRFLTLIFLMILSPIMFLGWVFPGFSGISKKYWDTFLTRAFVAPAYLLMLYFSYQVLSSLRIAVPDTDALAVVFSNSPEAAGRAMDAGGVFIFFILAIGFLVLSIVVAEKMGVEGSKSSMALVARLSGGAKRVLGASSFGLAAWGAQRTIGSAAQKYAESDKANRWAARSRFGSAALRSARSIGDSSFDGRRVGGFGKTSGLGEGSKGGFKTRVEEAKKNDLEFAKSLKTREVTDDDISWERRRIGTALNTEVKAQKRAEEAASEAVEKEEALKNEINELSKEKAALEAEIRKNEGTGNDMSKQEARLASLQTDLATKSAAQAAAKQTVEATEKIKNDAIKKVAELEDETRAKLTYANQLAFIERRSKELDTLQSRPVGYASAGAGAGAAALVGGGLIAVPLAAAGGFLNRNSYTQQKKASLDALSEEYGKNGMKAVKKKKSKDAAKAQIEALKEVDGTDTTKDDKKEDK